jgi:CRISPR-associated endoribonuclease Cas6
MAHRDGWAYLNPGETYRIRLSTYSQEMTAGMDAVVRFLANRESSELFLAHTPMQLIEAKALGEPLTYAALLEESFARADIQRIVVRFVTPTSFRRQGVQLLFPEPVLTVESLLRRWQLFSEVELPMEDMLPIEQAVRVTQYELSTGMVRFDRYGIIGFRGEVSFSLDKELSLFQKGVLRALFRLAEYTGIGYKTTMGMGEVNVRFMSK